MLSSLSEAAAVLNRQDYREAAVANGSFLVNSMTGEGYLRHAYKDGKARIEGYLEDYAPVIEGLLNLHQATFSGQWLREAIRLAGVIVEEFWDESAGIFYDTGNRHQALFVRPRSTQDGALPSGSSSATLALLKVARLTGDKRLAQIGARSLGTVRESLSRFPLGFGHWLCALDYCLSTSQEIVIVGPPDSRSTLEMMRVLHGIWLPNKTFAALDTNDPTATTELNFIKNRGMVDDQPTAYVCEGYSCQTPVTNPDLLRSQLQRLDPHV
jgi:hypothetical protein